MRRLMFLRSIARIAPSSAALLDLSEKAASRILLQSLRAQDTPHRRVVVVTDDQPCSLAQLIADGYRRFLTSSAATNGFPDGGLSARFIKFNPNSFLASDLPGALSMASDNATTGGPTGPCTVVLIQNGAFQNEMKTYRLRLRLFDDHHRVAEHAHLDSMSGDDHVAENYLLASGIDHDQCHLDGTSVAKAIDACQTGVTVECRSGARLVYAADMERCLLNTGIYAAGGGGIDDEHSTSASVGAATATVVKQRPIGGSYPVGEVITESRRLSSVSGEATIVAFPNTERRVVVVEPFNIKIENGVIVEASSNAPSSFLELLDLVRNIEGEAIIRELGIGLNEALSTSRLLPDVTSFERQRGIHVSMGKRHPLFPKNSAMKPASTDGVRTIDTLRRKDGRFHIDLFLDAASLKTNDGSFTMTF